MVDHRDVTLQAVKQRYADEDCCKVSEIEVNKLSILSLCLDFDVMKQEPAVLIRLTDL